MQVSRNAATVLPSSQEREAALGVLRSQQRELLGSITSDKRSTQTLIGHVLAEGCLDRLALTIGNEDDHRAIYDWVSGLRSNPAIQHVPSIMNTCIEHVEAAMRGQNLRVGAFEPAFTQIRANIELLVEELLSRYDHVTALGTTDIDARINQLIAKLEINDPPTAEHSRSVSLWCSRIARRMALPREHELFVKRSGLIHDIGKMQTPKEILHAPRALDEEEWRIMQLHPVQGAEIIQGIPELRHLAAIVRGHHERFDGRGYPDGIAGSDIPMASRIVTVADSFNAMIAQRPYRRPFSPTVALEELKRHRGTQFDPRIVEAMIDVVSGAELT